LLYNFNVGFIVSLMNSVFITCVDEATFFRWYEIDFLFPIATYVIFLLSLLIIEEMTFEKSPSFDTRKALS